MGSTLNDSFAAAAVCFSNLPKLCWCISFVLAVFQTKKGDGFYSEVIESISDARHTPDGRYIVSRDYLTLKLWDVNMEKKPLAVFPVHDYLDEYLSELHQNECIFDKFDSACSPNSQYVIVDSRWTSRCILAQACDPCPISCPLLDRCALL